MRLPPWKNLSHNSRLCRYSSLISKRLRDHMLYLARFQVMSTCVIFTHSKINHVTSHMTNLDARHPTPAFPLWNTDMITTLGRLPSRDVRSTSYLGNTPVWKLQNQDNRKTQWPDHDIRMSFSFCHRLPLFLPNHFLPFLYSTPGRSPHAYLIYLWTVLAFSRDFHMLPWPSTTFFDLPLLSTTF